MYGCLQCEPGPSYCGPEPCGGLLRSQLSYGLFGQGRATSHKGRASSWSCGIGPAGLGSHRLDSRPAEAWCCCRSSELSSGGHGRASHAAGEGSNPKGRCGSAYQPAAGSEAPWCGLTALPGDHHDAGVSPDQSTASEFRGCRRPAMRRAAVQRHSSRSLGRHPLKAGQECPSCQGPTRRHPTTGRATRCGVGENCTTGPAPALWGRCGAVAGSGRTAGHRH